MADNSENVTVQMLKYFKVRQDGQNDEKFAKKAELKKVGAAKVLALVNKE